MRRRHRIVRELCVGSGLALAAVLLMGDPAPAPVQAKASCALKGSKTLRASRAVRILEKRHADGFNVYGCLYAVGRKYLLGFKGGGFDDKVTILALGNPYVAYLAGYFGENLPHFFLYVKDLRSGVTAHQVDEEHPRNVVLHRSGAAAWTTITCLWDVEDPLPGAAKFTGDSCRYVVKTDAAGSAVVDANLKIKLDSIKLDGTTVRWTTNGHAKSYVLRTRRLG
jgi:hypothetical protein